MLLEKAGEKDIAAVSALYDAICDWLETHENYPHWKKGVYPSRQDAEEGVRSGTLYVCREGGAVIGSVRLSHEPEAGYAGTVWGTADDYARILVVYSLAVDPAHLRTGVAGAMMAEAEKLAGAQGCIAMRLDAVKGNVPAERLYARCGFRFVTTKSLGYEAYGLPLFDLFEKIL